MADEQSNAEKVAEATGLSRRAAEWTALAAIHSGVFIRPQVRAWLKGPTADANRSDTARIVGGLRDQNLATEIDVAGMTAVHIHGKAVYQALGEPDNRNRRKPSREKALERLLALDYVLDHPDESWLPTERAKTSALAAAGVPKDTWSSRRYESAEGATTRHFVEKWPLAINADSRRAVLACVSPGSTEKRLQSWLRDWDPLVRALGAAGCAVQLVHIACRPALSDRAAALLQKAAAKFGADGDEDLATIRKIKTAILADREEAFEPFGGFQQALQTAREIYGRRGESFEQAAAQPADVGTEAWTSTRIRPAERAQ